MALQEQGPPKSVEKLLSFFCKGDLLEEILGDLEEYYYDELVEKRKPQRWLYYWFQAFNFLRPFALKQILSAYKYNPLNLYRNYFKTSYRNLMKNPLSSFINIVGLAIAIGVCMIVYAFFDLDYRLDKFHENKDNLFVAIQLIERNGDQELHGTSPIALGSALKQEFPQINKVCRIKDQVVLIKHKDQVLQETIRFTDPEFLQMLTFPLKWGLSNSLYDLNNIILSEKMSIKYFGNENPLGKELLMTFPGGVCKLFTVTGVAEPFPRAHIVEFDFLVNFQNLKIGDPGMLYSDWSQQIQATLIQVNDPHEVNYIESCMDKYAGIQSEISPDWPVTGYQFLNFGDLHMKSSKIRGSISFDDNLEARKGTPVIGIFVLILACFNYINIAIVSAAKRLKEIGLRKVIGATKRQVTFQFLAENLLVTFFALILGFFLCVTLFNPGMKSLSFGTWDTPLILDDYKLWLFLLAFLLFTGIISGLYPAIYIARFDPVKIFKGTTKFGKKNVITKIFLGVQLIMTCAVITIAVIFAQNDTYQSNKSWGYDQNELLYVKVSDGSSFELLKEKLLQEPNVLSVVGAADHIGMSWDSTVMRCLDRSFQVRQYAIDADYPQIMGFQLLEGRSFDGGLKSDEQTVIINETLAGQLPFLDPIGKQLKRGGQTFEIIGVMKDFHADAFSHVIQPVVFVMADKPDYRFVAIKVREGTETETYIALRKHYTDLFPDLPFVGGHQVDVWGDYFMLLGVAKKFYRVLAIMAILLASLGLYGLVTLNVTGRVREFSIRKAMGAGLRNIASIITKQYLLLLLAAVVIGIPFSYYLTVAALDLLYAYPVPVSFSGFAIAIIILVVVILGVISTQIRKVSKANPVDGLKVE